MSNESSGGGGAIIAAVLVIVIMAIVIGGGALSNNTSARKLEAQAQIAQANAQQAQARAQALATMPLAVASIKDSMLVVWYALRDASRELVYSIVIALLAWRLWARKPQASQVKEPQEEYPDGTEV